MVCTPVKRTYTNFRGVDFANDPALVNLSRSPDALNVWRNYSDMQESCIETRPGYKKLGNFEGYINGMHVYNGKALVHAGTNLFLWNNFPDTPEQKVLLKGNMNNKRSSFAIFNDKLYILDGANYLVYDGILKSVRDDNSYIPTTSISRNPSGGGELYEDVNLLSSYRKNSFLSDGTSINYYLDAKDIDEVTNILVNDKEVTEYDVDLFQGMITFKNAPEKPNLSGVDNVIITFKKVVDDYVDRIEKCTKVVTFDRRLFFAGNPNFPNALFNCKLNNPSYISDLDYYQDGTDESGIKALVVGNNVLWVFKEPNQQNETIFYHTPATYSSGRVYPNYQGNVSVGCFSDAINYKDDILFLSKNGLEGISSNDIGSKQLLSHKSSLVDNKLINENNFRLAMMAEWEGYLLLLVNNKVYLADIRQMFEGVFGYEYEWYLWQFNDKICYLKEYQGFLYLGAEDGSFFVLDGTNDDGKVITSYWSTPMDSFGYENMNKTTNKRGGIAKIKTIPNGMIKVAEKTNKMIDGKYITQFNSNGFDFNNFDFSNVTFITKNNSYIVYKIKEKKFVEISLRFYSDELNKPFGIYSAILEAFIGGYVKK